MFGSWRMNLESDLPFEIWILKWWSRLISYWLMFFLQTFSLSNFMAFVSCVWFHFSLSSYSFVFSIKCLFWPLLSKSLVLVSQASFLMINVEKQNFAWAFHQMVIFKPFQKLFAFKASSFCYISPLISAFLLTVWASFQKETTCVAFLIWIVHINFIGLLLKVQSFSWVSLNAE